jgi:hypothetical protein
MNIHARSGISTHSSSSWAATDIQLRLHGHCVWTYLYSMAADVWNIGVVIMLLWFSFPEWALAFQRYRCSQCVFLYSVTCESGFYCMRSYWIVCCFKCNVAHAWPSGTNPSLVSEKWPKFFSQVLSFLQTKCKVFLVFLFFPPLYVYNIIFNTNISPAH